MRIDDWLAAKNEAGLSWSTRSDFRNLMSCIFRQAKKWGRWKHENPAQHATVGRKRMVVTCSVLNWNGGPERTRISDLYRVKVRRSITCRHGARRFNGLHASDVDSIWTPAVQALAFGLRLDSMRTSDEFCRMANGAPSVTVIYLSQPSPIIQQVFGETRQLGENRGLRYAHSEEFILDHRG